VDDGTQAGEEIGSYGSFFFLSIVSQFVYSYIYGDKLSTYDDVSLCSLLLQNMFVDKYTTLVPPDFLNAQELRGSRAFKFPKCVHYQYTITNHLSNAV